MPFGGDQPVDGEGRGSAQDRPDIVRIGDLVEHDRQPVRRQFGDVDRRERPRLEQHPLMDRLARRAGGNLLEAQDPRLDSAGGDLGLEALRRGGGGV